eukprot:318175_1
MDVKDVGSDGDSECVDVVNQTIINNTNNAPRAPIHTNYNISSKQYKISDENSKNDESCEYEEHKLEEEEEVSTFKGKTNFEEKYMNKAVRHVYDDQIKSLFKPYSACSCGHNQKHKDTEWIENHCSVCSKSRQTVNKLFQCSRCKSNRKYCSVDCQRKDWPKHKKQCKK